MKWRLIGSMMVAACALLAAVGVAEAGEPGDNARPTWEKLIMCLNAHGVQPPATNDPVQLKTWFGERYESDPAVKAAFDACAPDAAERKGGAPGPSLTELIACLRSHGVQAPDTTDPRALKTWLGERYKSDPAVEAALVACAPAGQKEKETTNPSLTELRTCLVQAGINVSDDVDLKVWLGRVFDQARVKQALRTCGVTVAKKRTSSKKAKVTVVRLVV